MKDEKDQGRLAYIHVAREGKDHNGKSGEEARVDLEPLHLHWHVR